jgi:hypothetical protein
LKNHALLLFGPSSFEHWFKSCKSFTVRSLPFSDFTDQSTNQFIPFSSSRRLCSPCSASPGSSAAGVTRRSGSPPAISCASPSTRCFPAPHRPSPLLLAPHPSATFSPGCQHCTPECLPPPQFFHRLALSFPLFYSVGSATLHCLFPSLNRLPNPGPRLSLPFSSSLRHRSRPLSSPAYAANTPPRPNPADPESPHLLPLPYILIQSSPDPFSRRICSTPSRPSIGAAELGFTVDSPSRHLSDRATYGNRLPMLQ